MVIDKDKLVEEIFYQICDECGWSREEVDSMGLTPDRLELDTWWTAKDLKQSLKKCIENHTGYYVEIVDRDDGTYFELHNAVWKQLGHYRALTKEAEDLRDGFKQLHVYGIPPLKFTVEWLAEEAFRIISQTPDMKMPDKPIVVMG